MATKAKAKTRAKAKTSAAKTKRTLRPAAKAKAKAKPAAKAAPPEWAPPTGVGTFCWNELMAADVPSAKAFYGSLFGWGGQDMPMTPEMTYTAFQRGTDGVGGLMKNPAPTPPAWLAYVWVADVDESARKVKALGGTVVKEPFDIPQNHGRCAIFVDPQGACLGLYSPPASR
jgi:predicted enzyme related to lactoylglutathione lyase